MSQVEIPVVYAFIYTRIKKNTKTNFIHVTYLKEQIWRCLKENGGIPRYYNMDIIEDFIKLGLIERISHNGSYKILDSECSKKILTKENIY